MTYKLEDTSLRLKDEMDLYRKMMDKLRQNRHEFQKEREAMQEVGGGIAHTQGHTCAHTHKQTHTHVHTLMHTFTCSVKWKFMMPLPLF